MKRLFEINDGDRFDHILVINRSFDLNESQRSKNRIRYNCICDCGKELTVDSSSLRTGRTRRCPDCAWKHRSLITFPQVSQVQQLYNHAIIIRCRDSKKHIENNLSIDEYESLIYKDCYYCGEPPSEVSKFKNRKYANTNPIKINGIDRLDSSIGYELSNCVPCCTACNRMKNDINKSQFLSRVMKIYNNLNLKDESS